MICFDDLEYVEGVSGAKEDTMIDDIFKLVGENMDEFNALSRQ